MFSKLHSFDSLSKDNPLRSTLLDTNFILNFTHRFTNHPKVKNVADCTNFLKSLATDNCDIYIPNIVINEFCFQVYMNIVDEYKKRHTINTEIIEIYRKDNKTIRPGHKQIQEAVNNLDIIRTSKKFNESGPEFRNIALKLMRKYDLLPSDAFIGAIAIQNQIETIATLDIDFARSISCEPNIHVYLPEDLYQRHFANIK